MSPRMNRRRFLHGAAAMAAVASAPVTGRRRAASETAGTPVPPGFTSVRITETTLTVDGKTARVYEMRQPNGTEGYVGVKGGVFRVALDNETKVPVSIHWHGLILPNGQDGVPYVTQPPIEAGQRRLYEFPLVQAGTYWMHSHWGLHEQLMMTAPLILRDPGAPPDEHDVVMVVNDFTARDPAAILADLRHRGARGMHGGMHASGASARRPMTGPDLVDVQYDALLVNRRPPSDPEVVRVLPGRPVRLRVINAASGSNVFVRTGALPAHAIAVDGADIAPLAGSVFELAVAQRIDLRVRIPRGAGAYPIIVQAEGTDLIAGLVLATPGARVAALPARVARPAGALDNRQERRLRPTDPLPRRRVDRTVRVALGGDMSRYVWTIDGQTWPNVRPIPVRRGERVRMVFANETGMAHPMHLHGHVFQVTAIDGTRLDGARRDTVLVLPRQTVTVEFDAAYPGYWMLHCHLLYHQAAGMMTVVHYEGFENRAYDPQLSWREFAH